MSHCYSIITDLRRRGYRITPQREMIVQAIAHSDRHMSAEDILTVLQTQTQAINIATVYRTLDMLWAEGFVYRNDLSEGKAVYTTYEHGPHVHLVCRKCKQIIDAGPRVMQSLGQELLSRHGFHADLDHISIFGVCFECKTEKTN